jgi:acyl transferase domain-containing protein
VDGQARVIVEALANADVTADTISYVEAHGTGTPQGDPIEIAALSSAFSADSPAVGCCAIGSVKSNIGHLDAAAGVTGLIKTVLMLQHRELPPTLHFTVPNPQIDFASSPFRVNHELTEWHANAGPRRAGVSAFGIGGTNVHVVLEEAPPAERRRSHVERPCHLLTLSAKTPAALRALADRHADHFAATPDRLGDICHTAAIGRAHWNHRAAVLVDTADRTIERLRLLAKEQLDLGVSAGQAGQPPRIAFLFAGQGGQYPGMGRGLYEAHPVYRAAIDRCAASLRHELQRPLLDVMFADPDDEMLHQTQYTQPALFAVEYAMSELWRSWGIEPAAVIGHSMGEYAAACVAGAISLEEALPLVAAQWQLCSLPKRSSHAQSPTFRIAWRSRRSMGPSTS